MSMTRKDFVLIAEVIRSSLVYREDKQHITDKFIRALRRAYPLFDAERFRDYALGLSMSMTQPPHKDEEKVE